MRDFNFDKGEANISAANIAGVRPDLEEDRSQTILLTEPARDEASLSDFHKSADDAEEDSNNTAKIAGAVIVGLLLVGGGIYAYETTARTSQPIASVAPAPRKVAMTQPAPMTPPAALPDTSTTPDTSATPITAAPARATPVVRQARDLASPKDEAVNAPMTLTPDTAPPAEQASASQAASSQAPATTSPTPEVANNAVSGVTFPAESTIPAAANTAPASPAPAATPDSGSAQPAPAPAP